MRNCSASDIRFFPRDLPLQIRIQDSEKARKAVLLRVLNKQLQIFAADPKEAEKLAWKERPAGADARTLAAWTIVSRVILNLDEAITRE